MLGGLRESLCFRARPVATVRPPPGGCMKHASHKRLAVGCLAMPAVGKPAAGGARRSAACRAQVSWKLDFKTLAFWFGITPSQECYGPQAGESPAHAVPRDDLPPSLMSPVGYDDSGTNMHWQSTGQISQKARAATYRPHQARPEREATYRQRSRNRTC